MCAPVWAAAVEEKDVEFARPDGKPLLLDLHVPDGRGPFPAAILVHGGGFTSGSRIGNVRLLFEPLEQAGIAWFTIDYRLAPAATLREASADVDSAIRWVKANATKYRIDERRMVLIGESAGGFLVNYAGTHETKETKVAAVVSFYGPADYEALALRRRDHPELFNMASINRHASLRGGIHFIGAERLDDAGLATLRANSPINAVHQGMPPFLCIHGTKDDQVNYEQSPAFCDEMRKVNVPCEVVTVPGGAHGMANWKDAGQQNWRPAMAAWLKKTLQSR